MFTTLLVDDLRDFKNPPAGLVVTRTSKAGVIALKSQKHWHELWLDHDLGLVDGEPDTVWPVVDYLSEAAFLGYELTVDKIYVHSSNPVGARQMLTTLSRCGYRTKAVPAARFFTVPKSRDQNSSGW